MLKKKKRKVYGGYAINMLLKNIDEDLAVYSEVDDLGADVDFYSCDPLQDLIDICNELHDNEAKEIDGKEAGHDDTYSIFINQQKSFFNKQ